jgi:short-subunit dehydrogenase
MNIRNKVAVVTGASSGIGFSTAGLLTKDGARVALVARSLNKLKELAKELKGSFVVKTDMSKEGEIRKMIKEVKEHFGRIDILVNNAGRGYDASIEKTDIKLFRDLSELDLIGPLVAMQEVIPVMKKQGGGVIVNISSGTALMTLPNMAGYSALKRAVVGLSLTAREELKKDKISVSVVYPFITNTDFEKNTLKSGEKFEYSGGVGNIPDADPPELIAEKIVEAIKTGKAEIFAHDWMKRRE